MNHTAATLVGLCCVLFGCASDIVTVWISSEVAPKAALAHVAVQDLRTYAESASRRETFGMSMGYVNFSPPETTLVKNFLENQLSAILQQHGVQTPQDYSCEIIEFGVSTSNTPLYWDLIGHIRLVLKHGNTKINLDGSDHARTYIWPGEEIIAQVINGSLGQISSELQQNASNIR
jgi:hypothetical protein